MNHAELRTAAENATPGPWEHLKGKAHPIQGSGTGIYAKGQILDTICWMQLSSQPNWFNDATYIALANPVTVLGLLDEIDALRLAVERESARYELCLEQLGPRRFQP